MQPVGCSPRIGLAYGWRLSRRTTSLPVFASICFYTCVWLAAFACCGGLCPLFQRQPLPACIRIEPLPRRLHYIHWFFICLPPLCYSERLPCLRRGGWTWPWCRGCPTATLQAEGTGSMHCFCMPTYYLPVACLLRSATYHLSLLLSLVLCSFLLTPYSSFIPSCLSGHLCFCFLPCYMTCNRKRHAHLLHFFLCRFLISYCLSMVVSKRAWTEEKKLGLGGEGGACLYLRTKGRGGHYSACIMSRSLFVWNWTLRCLPGRGAHKIWRACRLLCHLFCLFS